MLLSGKNIEQHLTTSEFSKTNQVGIDLSVKKIEKIFKGGQVLKDRTVISSENYYELLPSENKEGRMTWKLIEGAYALTFNEKVTIPPNYTGFILHRSSIMRSGGMIVSAIWDPGFTTGDNDMGTTLFVHVPIEIEKDARVAQFYMMSNETVDELYNGQFQNKTNY
jgi:deoxycytidine triphosphate deaminase